MKAKVKKNKKLLSVPYQWKNISNTMIINFVNRYTYLSFKQQQNHLLINTTEGIVDIVFIGETPQLEFDYFEKDQLVLNVINKES